jgi:hypothetical protein
MMNEILRHDKHCRVCGEHKIVTIIQLKDTPLEDHFVSRNNLNNEQPVYPLELALCEVCGYVHLPYLVNPIASYASYTYNSAITVGLRSHFDKYAEKIATTFCIKLNSLVVDLGSNDGSMLASFKKIGMQVLGVEPARDIALQANSAGLTTINAFFTKEIANQIINVHGVASLVTANYMYANVDNVIEFTKNVTHILSQDGLFVIQTGYHPEQMKINMFDYIYHEHFSYFTVEVLQTIFLKCGLEVIHVEKTSPKGGSIRVVGQLLGGKRQIESAVSEIILEERRAGINKIETYKLFSKNINEIKNNLHFKLNQLKKIGKKIVGFGASHSTTTLIYHFELSYFIDYLIDDNTAKHGLYSPGYHLPVYSTDVLYEDPPDYVLILAWQHQESIITKHNKYSINGGYWIVPLPRIEIL